MNQREIGEIRRRVRRDRSNMTSIYGCYVNGQKEIISSFKQSVGMMPENEAEKYFGVLKRTLSGTIGKNLIDISFRTAQVANSPEHSFLMELRKCALQNDDLRMALFQKIIDNVSFEDSFLILVGCDSYDVPFKSKDDETQLDASGDVYTYRRGVSFPAQGAEHFQSVHTRHHDIQDQHVVDAHAGRLQRVRAVVHPVHVVMMVFQEGLDRLGHRLFIFRKQKPHPYLLPFFPLLYMGKAAV